LSFGGSSTGGTANITNNGGIVEFVGNANGGSAVMTNAAGGFLTLEGTTRSTITMSSLTNSSGGGVAIGKTVLQLSNGLTLNTAAGNFLDFAFDTVGSKFGEIVLTGGTFTESGAGAGNPVNISLTYTPGTVLAGTYDLIDWSTVSASGVTLSDFQLSVPPPFAGATLQINNKKLQLVAAATVPDGGNTFALFGCIVAGLFFARRRLANA
jgi:hypothetical protein